MNRNPEIKTAVVLIGHGVPATDCPPGWVGEMMGLEWSAEAPGEASSSRSRGGSRSNADGVHQRIGELDAKIRSWPRTEKNDPYKIGLEKLAEVLRPLLGEKLFAIGYNEFCSPTIAEAIAQVVGQGAARILVIPTMLTPGGIHSEQDIPRAIEKARASHAAVSIEYLWPFDLQEVARLLASHVERVSQ